MTGYFTNAWGIDDLNSLLNSSMPFSLATPIALSSTMSNVGPLQTAGGADPAWILKCNDAWARCKSQNPMDREWVKQCSESLQQCLQTPGITTIYPGGIYVR